MSAHTPGPILATTSGPNERYHLISGNRIVAAFYGDEHDRADAELYAAAPDMYDMLVTVLARLDLESERHGDSFMLAATRKPIRDVLAMAASKTA